MADTLELDIASAAESPASLGDPVKLNIGAGGVDLPGYIPIDRKLGLEAYPLEGVEDGTVDEIRASHVLEHFATGEVYAVLKHWFDKLKPGGRLRLAVPDFQHIAARYLDAPGDRKMCLAYAFGGQTDDNDFHRAGFDYATLRGLMKYVGLRRIARWESEVEDCASLQVSLNLEGVKPLGPPVDLPNIAAVMSTGRLGFTENYSCNIKVLGQRGIPFSQFSGAYWGQCMERVLEAVINEGAEWICTLDYDTVFTGEVFDELCYLLATNPDVDAIAPWQAKRESNDMLTWITDSNGEHRTEITREESEQDLLPVDTAHFGLTLIRAQALRSMPHPWFIDIPGKDGKWNSGYRAADINFWHKFRDAGNTLRMAAQLSIGHLQQLVTWPDQQLRPIHQYLSEFQKDGPPLAARS